MVAVVVKHVVNGGFFDGFIFFVMGRNAGVSTVPGVFISARGGKTYELPKQARYQLRYTPMIILMWSPLWSNMWSTAVFLMGFENFLIDGNAGVSTVPGVFGFAWGGKAYTLPKQARYHPRRIAVAFWRFFAGKLNGG